MRIMPRPFALHSVTRLSSFGDRAAAVIRGKAAAVIRHSAVQSLVTRHLSRVTAALVAAMAATNASARTVSVSSVGETAALLAFGGADGKEYKLAVCYGDEDGGATTNAWDAFEILGSVGAAETSRTVALPAGWGSTATHLRFFLLAPEIPEDATRVEYLQSTGAQFIDTGIRGKVGITAEIDALWTSSADKTLLGSRNGSSHRFFVVHNNGGKLGFGLDGTFQYWTSAVHTSFNNRYVVRSALLDGSQTCTLDGAAVGSGFSISSSFDSGNDMYLFACNDNGSGCLWSSARVYSAKIWEGDALVRWFVPCLDPNGTPAMYDRVSGGYFYNNGSGADFTTGGTTAKNYDVSASSATVSPSSRSVTVVSAAGGSATLSFGAADGRTYQLAWGFGDEDGGADTNAWDSFEALGAVAAADTSRTVALPAGWGKTVTHLRCFLLAPEIPDGATRVEYLESTGAQFIDTGVRGKVGITAELDHSWTSASDKTLLGSRNGTSHRFFVFHNNKGRLGYGLDGTFAYYKGAADTSYDTRYLVLAKMLDGEQSLALDGTPYGTPGTISSSFDSGNDMYLFGCNDNGSLALSASAKIYSAKIWEGDALVRWFVPCLDPNGEPAMFDRATGAYFHNGTATALQHGGTVAAARTVASSSATVAAPLPPSVRYAYVESDGVDDYIDLGVVARDGTRMFADMEWVAIPADGVFCGSRKDSDATRFFPYSSYQGVQRYGYASGSPTVKKNGSSVAQSPGVRYRVTAQLEAGAQTVSIQRLENGAWSDDAANADTAAGPVDTGLPLYLFARNKYGEEADCFCAVRVYSLKLWQKDGNGDYRLVRSFVPAKTADGAAALWDRVTETWFRNADGAGALSAGAESPWSDGFVFSLW